MHELRLRQRKIASSHDLGSSILRNAERQRKMRARCRKIYLHGLSAEVKISDDHVEVTRRTSSIPGIAVFAQAGSECLVNYGIVNLVIRVSGRQKVISIPSFHD